MNIDATAAIGNDKTIGSDAMGKDVGGRKQMIVRRGLLTGIVAGALAALTTAPAASQDKYPSRPIRVVVPFPAGATTDMLARLFAQRLTETMGQSVVVENIGGAGGTLAAGEAAKAAADGHTLLVGNITFTTTTASLMYVNKARHTIDDIVPASGGA